MALKGSQGLSRAPKGSQGLPWPHKASQDLTRPLPKSLKVKILTKKEKMKTDVAKNSTFLVKLVFQKEQY